ncbi:hypothetical protein H310_05197 [Aphanomyces invadans]|uniref:RanBP-type and C3HC4-type zinc finger-containing protein 1 n=1 Tax=Aphanomyces invadans TaxID=157072 RepID=A0A024UBS4_9STRA|nr:hypothetical protein H310_05197 [Aphanomyces invadans]ETW03841.1 hypothetical protein H310_05197 [Aphanomyces invadans]|eukprot:XP_008868070.1 hypothetical protein H310_05197 [Aphanomyces invadans]
MDVGDDVDDEWVWPNELMEARLMEGILRCQVCGEFLSGPVILQGCRHTFCSECVRKHLLAKGTNASCPECKCACSSSDLIPNRPLEQLVGLFRALKPKVLHLSSSPSSDGGATRLAAFTTAVNTSAAPTSLTSDITTRLPTISYNVMKDSQIRQLMDKVGLQAILPTSKDNMITCHKEYTMLWNAQLDTMNPKTASQVRAEVIAKFRQRQQEKAVMASTRRSLGLRPDDPIEKAITKTSVLNDNFRKLADQARAQRGNPSQPQPAASPAKMSSKPHAAPSPVHAVNMQDEAKVASNVMANGDLRFLPREAPAAMPMAALDGTWRHLHSTTLDKSIYIHSGSAQVTDVPPSPFAKPPPLAPAKRHVETSTTWTCARCTLENEPHVEKCEVCGAPTTKPTRPKRSRQSKLSL